MTFLLDAIGTLAVRKEDVLVSHPIGTEAFGEDTQFLVSKCAGQAFHKFILPAPFEPPLKESFYKI